MDGTTERIEVKGSSDCEENDLTPCKWRNNMKIAVTTSGPTLNDKVDPRFGRCAWFMVVETDTMDFEALENPNTVLGGGAGIQSAQLMLKHDVKFVLTGNCGPNAFQTLEAAGIKIIVGVSGTVRQAIEQFKSGAFSTAPNSNVASHFGTGAGGADPTAADIQPPAQQTGGGMGMGQGMGGGRGMGRGMGMGGVASSAPGMTGEPGLDSLKAQAQALEEQLKAINAQISATEQKGK